MAEYRTVTAEATVVHQVINATASIEESLISVDTSVETTIAHSDMPIYDGAYEVTPDWHVQTLATRNRQMANDVTVKSIQLEIVSNLSGGTTAYIGGII